MAWAGIQIRALSRRRISARDSGISSPMGTGRLQGPLSVAGPPGQARVVMWWSLFLDVGRRRCDQRRSEVVVKVERPVEERP